MSSDTFCVMPWNHLEVDPDGTTKLCCMARGPITHQGRPMSLDEHSVAEIWGSDYMLEVRQDLLEGKKRPECGFCYENEQRYRRSFRTFQNGHWLSDARATAETLRSDPQPRAGALEHPEHLHVVLGNQCNLMCRMCSSDFSTGIAKDPVHSKWSPPRRRGGTELAWWKGRQAVIAPGFRKGIEASGFHPVEKTDDGLTCRTGTDARLRVRLSSRTPLESLVVRLAPGHPPGQVLLIDVDGTSVFRGELSEGPWEQELPLDHVGNVDWLEVRLRCTLPEGVTIAELALRRPERAVRTLEPPLATRFSGGGAWFEQDSLLFGELLRDHQSLKMLNLTGGEPMLIPQAQRILDYLIDVGAAEHVQLMMSTNCTVLPDRMLDKLSRFQAALLNLSLDGTGDVLEYLRYPAKWETVSANALRLRSLPNAVLTVAPTMQVYNVMLIVDLFRWCDRSGIAFAANPLSGPKHMDVLGLPRAARDVAAARLREYLATDCIPSSAPAATALATQLESEASFCTDETMRTFMLFTNDLDRSRGQSFADVHGELLELYRDAGLDWTDETRHHVPETPAAAVAG